MDRIDWYYIYSERYYPFHFYLQERIPSVFHAKGIFVPQSLFDEHLYKHEGEHFFSRITIKIESVLRIIKEKLEANDTRPFVFTDCDILIGPHAAVDLYKYTERTNIDMLFQREFKNTENKTVNPGAILLWPNKNTEQFWKTVLDDMLAITPNMEMASINKILSKETLDLSWDFFDTVHVSSSITASIQSVLGFSIHHILCDSASRELDIGDKMYEASVMGQNMDKYVKMTIEKYGRIFM